MLDRDKAWSKKKALIHYIENLDSLIVAFSGGVDSTFLLALAHQVLGEKVLAATASSSTYPSQEQEEAARFARNRGIKHVIFQSDETCLPAFSENSPDRCYHCKKLLSRELLQIAKERGISNIALAANIDDLGDYRPGITAAEEMGMIEPLMEAELTKQEIRFLSKEMDLPTWDKPAMACLASRIPYGEPVTNEKLKMVEEAERFLAQNGLRQCRVRHHGDVARIEVELADLRKIMDKTLREKTVERFKKIGFLHIALDLEGYITGSMNRALKKVTR
jgi:pyridinium-3,5-biscarboxylic acid mononucleotide sulfurtransferase